MWTFTMVIAIAAMAPAKLAVAQDGAATLDSLNREIQELRRSDAEKQRKLDELQKRVELMQRGPTSAPTQSQTTTSGTPAQSALDQAVADLPGSSAPSTIDSVTRDSVTRDAGDRDIFSKRVGGANLRLLDFSLDVLAAGGGSSVSDSELGNLQGGGHDPRKNGFTVQNVELSMSGAIDPYLYGEAHIIFFIDPIEGETVVELEEAFLTTQQLPWGLQVKAGQYFTEFGRLNARHPHQWEWMDQPIINTRLFGPDGMRGTGARIGWLTPLPWYSELLVGVQNGNGETMASFLANDEYYEERPIGGRPFVGQDSNAFNGLAYSLRWENGFDLSRELSSIIGASAAFGPNPTGSGGDTQVYGVDFTFKWRPVANERGTPYVISQTEVMYRNFDAEEADDGAGGTLPASTLEDYGFYSQLLYAWKPRWRAGVRLEYASGSGESVDGSASDPFRDDRYRLSPLVEFLPSEFSRIRLQYNYDDAEHLDDGDAHSVWTGFEYLIGSHSAHRY